MKDTATQDLKEALQDMQIAVKMTKGKAGLYHAQINPAIGENMDGGQWKYAVDEMERRLGLDNQPRAVVYHEKKGRPHMHVVWQRTDTEKGRVIGNSNDYYIHKQLGRDLEKTFNHKQLHNEFTNQWEKMGERQQAERGGYNSVKQMKARVKSVWEQNPTAEKLRSALRKVGFELAKGKKTPVILSKDGDIHSLARYSGAKAKAVRERLKPIYDQLPDAERARAKAKEQGKNKSNEVAQLKPSERPQLQKILREALIIHAKQNKYDVANETFKQKEFEARKKKFGDLRKGFSENAYDTVNEHAEERARLERWEELQRQLEIYRKKFNTPYNSAWIALDMFREMRQEEQQREERERQEREERERDGIGITGVKRIDTATRFRVFS